MKPKLQQQYKFTTIRTRNSDEIEKKFHTTKNIRNLF